MKVAQIFNNKAHWIFETHETIKDVRGRFPSNLTFIDITGLNVQEGWDYIGGVFKNPNELTPEQVQQQKYQSINSMYATKEEQILKAISQAQARGDTATVTKLNATFVANREAWKNKLLEIKNQ